MAQRSSSPSHARSAQPVQTTAETQQLQRLASTFTPSVYKGLSRTDFDTAGRLGALAQLAGSPNTSLADAFDLAHDALRRAYRNEYVFKNELVSKIVFGRHSTRTAAALLEVPMGRSCADVVVMNGTSTAYEIKTDLDQFTRMETQLMDYSRHVEHVNVVVSVERLRAASQRVPAHVGIIGLRHDGSLTTVRSSESNLDRIRSDDLFLLLRTSEALELLRRVSGYELDVPRGHAWSRAREVFAELDLLVAHRAVVDQLRKRGAGAAWLTTSPGFPQSLRAMAYETELSPKAGARVLERLTAPLAEIQAH